MSTIIITGDRAHPNPTGVIRAFQLFCSNTGDSFNVIRHGACPTEQQKTLLGFQSVDEAISSYIEAFPHAFDNDPHPADWDAFGKMAGPIRNRHMASLGADFGLALPTANSRGTRGCIRELVSAEIPTLVLEAEDLDDFDRVVYKKIYEFFKETA